MGFLTWETTIGKIWIIILFLVIFVIILLVFQKVIPEMQFAAGIFDNLKGS